MWLFVSNKCSTKHMYVILFLKVLNVVPHHAGNYVPLCGRTHGYGNCDLLPLGIIIRSRYVSLLSCMGYRLLSCKGTDAHLYIHI